MTLSAKHKVYGAVLVVGVIAVTVDRVLILPDEAAADRPPSAHYAVTPPSTTAVASVSDNPPSSVSTVQAVIADRLEQLAASRGFDLQRVPNAFVPPTSWEVAETPESLPAGRVAAETFMLTHVLTGVMAAGDGGYAIIDGKTLFIGQVLDGFELLSVSDRSAVFEANGVRVELMLAEQGP